MSAIQIEKYQIGWHPDKGSAYRIKPLGMGWGNWTSVPASDLAALAAIFNEQPVYIQSDKWITTAEEPIGL